MTTESTMRNHFLAKVAASGIMTVADSFTLDATRADLIETVYQKVVHLDRNQDGSQHMRVDVIESFGPEGWPIYTQGDEH
jgi:hypothetical protein